MSEEAKPDIRLFDIDELIEEIKRRSINCLIVFERDPESTEKAETWRAVQFNSRIGALGCIDYAKACLREDLKREIGARYDE